MHKLRVGGSLKRALLNDFVSHQQHFQFLEFVPESWNPNDRADLDVIKTLNNSIELLPHCLSLNMLGDGPDSAIESRVKRIAEELNLHWISDHFSWSSAGGLSTGVFIPPLTNDTAVKNALEANLRRFDCEIALENIACNFSDTNQILRYHQLFVSCAETFNFPVIIDFENIRLDACNSGLNPRTILEIYECIENIKYYHIAGGTQTDGAFLDTHDQVCELLTIELLITFWKSLPKPVIYERDYSINFSQILAELMRLDRLLDSSIKNDSSN